MNSMKTRTARPARTFGRPSGVLSSAPLGFKIFFGIVSTLVALTFVLVIGGSIMANTGLTTYENCHVSGKHVAVVDGYSQYRVSTENCGSFIVADSVFKGKFNSADAYSQITEGKSYDFVASGYRIPLISAFPNIISFSESGKF